MTKRDQVVLDILDEIAKVRSMVGYTGEGLGEGQAADVWLGASLHRIEDAALYLSLTEATK